MTMVDENNNINEIMNFKYIKFTIGFALYFALLILIYILIFKKYNKRNKLRLTEIVKNAVDFFAKTTCCVLLVALGVWIFFLGFSLRETRSEEITAFVVAFIIVVATILYYIRFIKKGLVDLNQDLLLRQRVQDDRVSERVLLVVLILMSLLPIWSIKYFIDISYDKIKLIKSILQVCFIALMSFFLLLYLNPTGIREKLFKNKNKNLQEVNKDKEKISIKKYNNSKENSKKYNGKKLKEGKK